MDRHLQHSRHAHQALRARDQMHHQQQLHLPHLTFRVELEQWQLVRDLYQGGLQLQFHVLHRLQLREDQ